MKKIASNRNYRLLKIKNTIQLNKLGKEVVNAEEAAAIIIKEKVNKAILKYADSWPISYTYIMYAGNDSFSPLMDEMANNASRSDELAKCILDLMKKD